MSCVNYSNTMNNKKIKNASVIEYDGITFRSHLEVKVYRALKDAGYTPHYEVEKIPLLDSFRPNRIWYLNGEAQITKKGKSTIILGKTYTPDFKLTVGNTTIYIEVKGHPNDVYPITRKLFLRWIDEQENDIVFAEIHNMRGLNKFIDKLNTLNEKNI